MCLQTFVSAVSLSPQSHKALSVPGWSREPRPKNRLSDKELKAAGGLRIEKRNRKSFFFSPTPSPSLFHSLSLSFSLARSLARVDCRQDDQRVSISETIQCQITLPSQRLSGALVFCIPGCGFSIFSVEAYSVMPSLCLCL